MKSNKIILRGIQGFSLIGIFALTSIGFFMPVSIVQGLMVHPVLFILFVAIYSLAGMKIKDKKAVAHIHHLPFVNQRVQLPCCKAA